VKHLDLVPVKRVIMDSGLFIAGAMTRFIWKNAGPGQAQECQKAKLLFPSHKKWGEHARPYIILILYFPLKKKCRFIKIKSKR
jgi:hypothetical protein